jgi:hypothetical protein
MADNKLAKSVSDLVDRSMSDVISTMDDLDADALINLQSAVDAEDQDLAVSILDQVAPPVKKKINARDTLFEINRVGKKTLDQGDPMDKIWELIGDLKQEDWQMIWPAVREEIMIALYMEATDEETDSISADQSEEIYDYAKTFITESYVMYKNQICEVVIPRGPHNTLGVSYMGKTKMVNKSDVAKLDEHVMGVTAMPTLGRMLELAGMPPVVQEQDSEFEGYKGLMLDIMAVQAMMKEITNNIESAAADPTADPIVIRGVGTLPRHRMPGKLDGMLEQLADRIKEFRINVSLVKE